MVAFRPRLVVFGIDGASHRLTQRWCAAGGLPVLASLAKKTEQQSPLVTAFPPHTAPGWASIFSGVTPGEHGIYQFWELQARAYRPTLSTVADFGREPLWRTLERHGLSVGLYNVPMTHPPEPIRNGFMITWPMTPTLGYSYPRSLVHELASRGLHYQSDLVTMYREGCDYFTTACEQIERKTDTLLYLLDAHPVDVMLSVYTELDRVSHYYWGNDEEPGAEVRAIYQAMDCALGRLLDALHPDVPVLVVSDHGFGVCRSNLNVNTLLEEAGLLMCRAATSNDHSRDRSDRFFRDTDLALSAGWFASSDGMRVVDWHKTLAYMPAPGCFGINFNLRGRQRDGTVDAASAHDVARDVARAVENVRLDGRPVFTVAARDDVYRGHRIDGAPDLILLPNRWDVMPAPIIASQLWASPSQAGVHREDGILFAKNFELASRPAGWRVEDVAPTCLARLGLPIPQELDGSILEKTSDHFVTEPAIRTFRTPKDNQYLADQVQVEKRLAQLGYL